VCGHERRRLAAEGVSQVLALFHRLLVPHQRDEVLLLRLRRVRLELVVVEVLVPTAEQPEVLVEPAAVGVEGRVRAEVPLAHRRGGVPCLLHHLGEHDLIEGQANVLVVRQPLRVVLVPEPLLVTPGEQAGPRGRAERVRHVPVRADDSGLGERVEVRGRDVLAPLETEVGVPEVVGHDNDHFRLPRLGGVDQTAR
jgi:hypothetical protein